jgi:hypothetical protein
MAMTGRSGITKARFHAALSEAVRRHLGSEWTRSQFDGESWTARYRVTTSQESRTLEFQLSDKQHTVSVTLGIARQPADRRASVWWDDRKKDPTALAFANVLWVNELKYGAERRYQVPKESVTPQFVEVIDGMVREVAGQADHWYAEAARELDRREGV